MSAVELRRNRALRPFLDQNPVASRCRRRIVRAVATTFDGQALPVAAEDRDYAGSPYPDVVGAIFANPYQRVWGAPGEPPLPIYEVTFASVFGGLIFGATRQFHINSERTLDSGADLRWGKDRKGFLRLVHPNG